MSLDPKELMLWLDRSTKNATLKLDRVVRRRRMTLGRHSCRVVTFVTDTKSEHFSNMELTHVTLMEGLGHYIEFEVLLEAN